MQESIYELIPRPTEATKKTAMHRSKYPPNNPPTASTFGRTAGGVATVSNIAGRYELPSTGSHVKSGATFGPKDLHYSDPTQFLKKTAEHGGLPQPRRFVYTDRRKPPVDRSVHGSTVGKGKGAQSSTASKRNFITENAVDVIMSKPLHKQTGDVNYLNKPDFGRVPEYLRSVKQEIQAEKDYINQIMAQEREEEAKSQPKMRLMPEEERLELLENLKKKWEAINKQYQACTHIVTLDTIGKVQRKEKYESQLAELEKSIERLSKKFIFVHE